MYNSFGPHTPTMPRPTVHCRQIAQLELEGLAEVGLGLGLGLGNPSYTLSAAHWAVRQALRLAEWRCMNA